MIEEDHDDDVDARVRVHFRAALRQCGVAAAIIAFGLISSGCSPARHRRAADKEVYSIIQKAEQQIFGHTNRFGIDTRYSQRAPAEIPAAEIIDDRQQTNRLFLTLSDALGLAITNSRDYQLAKEDLYLSALALTGERYAFSPHFFDTSSTATFDRNSDGTQTSFLRSQLSVGKTLRTGGLLSLTLANTILNYYTGTKPGRSDFSSIVAELSQPLLRGFGARNPAVENLTQAERDVIYDIREFAFYEREFALDIVVQYFSLLRRKDVIRNRYTNYLGRVRSTQRLQERLVDREKASDVGQTRQSELSAKNNYVTEVATYHDMLDSFKETLGLPIGVQLHLDDSLLRELASTGLVPVELDPDEAFRLAVNNQLRILNEIDRFEDSKRKVLVAADQLRPGLDLDASATLPSQGDTDYTRFDPDEVSAGASLRLDPGLDRLRERNQYRDALVRFERQLRSLSLALDQLKDEIERGLRTLDQRRETYNIQRSALEVATSRVEGALANLEAGRAEVRELVEAQDAQINAQIQLTSALIGYQEVRLNLMLQIGILDTELDRFWLRDHVGGRLQVRAPVMRPRPIEGGELVPPDKLFEN